MPEHKMQTIDGIRVRAEDVARYRARTAPAAGGQAPPLTAAQADPRAQGQKRQPDPNAFDPAEHTVLQVIAHLAEADEAETARVLDEEAKGEQRKGLLERREEFLDEAQQRAMAGPGGGA
ncbi:MULTISPECIES: hypothetical protein [unclassified Streptomyces]|uniref:hypothetical protein n=1 Tax=unclassified Streptomyces TaxID=2593676 RepID=UPI0008058A0A|nr:MULTISPECIES: hypothetical protein [unclassified Streptomyces]MYR76538.1 hypothetical protein [Streptomyces sp. SID4925]SBV00014.1 hypothetical protein YUMDRAFT_06305 [Streptomyces sp. OspMP-M45]